MLEFANYLKENFKEDVSSAEKIIQTRWDKVVAILKEAFDDKFSDRKTALYRIQNEFVDKKIAPPSIDVEFLKANMDYVVEKVNSLDEGEIRIIINNDVQKGAGASVTGIETESKKTKKKKVVEEDGEGVADLGPVNLGGAEADDAAAGPAPTEDEKIVKVTVADNKVIVEPSENTGLQKSEHEFESEEEAEAFVMTLDQLFQGFKIEKGEEEAAPEAAEKAAEKDAPAGKAVVAVVNAGPAKESAKPKGKVIKEADESDTPAGEEPEDAGEEPEDAGEEPEDAGEEPEDAGEEPEDADFNWEDLSSGNDDEEAEEETMPVRRMPPTEFNWESADLTKLINKIIKVDGKWYNVTSISENKEISCIDKEGKENKFNSNQIEDMECDINEICTKCKKAKEGEAEENIDKPQAGPDAAAEEEVVDEPESEPAAGAEEEVATLTNSLSPEMMAELKVWMQDPSQDMSQELWTALYDFYVDEMPYGVAKARTGDPYDWLYKRISDEIGTGEENRNQEAAGSEDDVPGTAVNDAGLSMKLRSDAEENIAKKVVNRNKPQVGEELSFAKLANRYLDEDMLSTPTMASTQTGGLTSKPGVINQKIDDVKPAPKAPVVKGPSNALTAKPGKPGEKIEKVPAPPKMAPKKGPSTALTAKPKAPSKKMDNVKAPPKMATKAGPTGKFTAKPGKPGEKIEKVPAPVIPAEYK